jgi:hypothetical protein
LKYFYKTKGLWLFMLAIAIIYSCNKEASNEVIKGSARKPKNNNPELPIDSLCSKPAGDSTENVIILVIDGARYADTWEAGGTLIPYRKELSKKGYLCPSFYNNGLTLTVSGHTAIVTGKYETLNNTGIETPTYPSFFQVWRKTFNQTAEKAWIVASKDKVEVIKNCTDPKWKDTFNPKTNCGNSGLGSGYRDDLTTLNTAKEILESYEPNLMLINFKQPDVAGHSMDSLVYLQGIFDTDNYVNLIWNFIQSHSHYKNKTALIVTNDHGRHSPGHLDGFISHGDDCSGCRHIEFMALGPDFKNGFISTTPYEQIDIAPTIAYLLGFKMPFGNGKIMKELLK